MENKKKWLLPLKVPSLQVELADDDVTDESLDRSESDPFARIPIPNVGPASFLRPPPSFHTMPKRGLIILSPNSPCRR
jgi:hypothetical protein